MKTTTQVLPIELAERSYDIAIGSGILTGAAEFILDRAPADHAVLITDENVEPICGDAIADQLVDHGLEVHLMVVPPGESTKSVDAAAELWDSMLAEGTDRSSIVVAVGGGVVGDLAGFVAATFARGLACFQIPTTLLAQVDSSVGGKTGINLPGAKNIVGAFWQPRGVLIDVDVLQSLPEREFLAGLAEVVKYGMILDAELFAFLESHNAEILARDSATLIHIVRRSCELKAEVVIADEREQSGLRSKLNYGHTFCHAFETITGYGQLLHGEAVAIGMHCAAELARRIGRIDADLVQRQLQLLTDLGLSTDAPEGDVDEMLAIMRRDKKAAAGKIRFVLPDRMGNVELVDDVNLSDVKEVLRG